VYAIVDIGTMISLYELNMLNQLDEWKRILDSSVLRFLNCFMMGEEIGRKGAHYMMYYYLTFTPKDGGYDRMFDQSLRKYVRAKQSLKFRHVRRAISKLMILSPHRRDLTKNV
jgi:hypothetical protein